MSSGCTRRLRWSLVFLAAFLPFGATQAADQAGEANDGGIRVRWTYSPRGEAGGSGLGELQLDLADAVSNQPLRYSKGRVFAWLQRRRGTLSDSETSCLDKAKGLFAQGIGRRADIDLNEYRLVTLNKEGSVAVINPFVGINNAKLESIIDLHASPRGWVAVPERRETWIATDQPAKLVALDMQSRKITAELALPENGAPDTVVYDASNHTLWVSLPGTQQIGRLDLRASAPTLGTLAAQGLTTLVSLASEDSADGMGGIVALHRNGDVVLHDNSPTPKRWHLDNRPVAAAYSALSRRIVVGTDEGGLVWLDPASKSAEIPERTLSLGHPISRLALFDGGRRGIFAGEGWAGLVDLASARLVATLAGGAGADDIVFSRSFAYATHAQTGRASLWSLADLRAGRGDRPLDVMTGSPAPESLSGPSLHRAVADPDGSGLLVASPADGMIFQYSEGMMAPSGSYSNYRRAALGIMVLDPSLREVEAGRYRGQIRYEEGGGYELILAGLGPRFTVCAPLALAPTAVRPLGMETVIRAAFAGEPTEKEGSETIRLRLDRTENEATLPLSGVADLSVLVFDKRRGWQHRFAGVETAPGEYEAEIVVPRPSRYEVLASSPSANLSFVEGRLGEVELGARP
ncbi:hypothetical protein NGM99_18465 [Mesorhizobium sp. RP14(2022)]|uniref:Uncharacterized protein n=1 Tax=Mesorhizobium liriopis TaxID=2953882 RepID=A0ABT1CBC6_9HYPH|nr:hypothetical protein [Mesorhizobium liriopis]MCO6051773.1 hypothetical protein [Mesorhizobium liriopis]